MDMPMNPPADFVCTLQPHEWNVVMTALHEAPLPARLTVPVINKLSQQFNARPAVGNGEAALLRPPAN